MSQAELFTATETFSTEVNPPGTIPEAIAVGYDNPQADNPFLWSSSFWEAFQIGQTATLG